MEIDFDNLRACPFCGQKPCITSHPGINWDGKEKHINKGGMFGLWYVGCPSGVHDFISHKCEIKPAAKWYADLKVAIRHWNERLL